MIKILKSLFLAATMLVTLLPIGARAGDLHFTAQNGDLKDVRRLVEQGADIDAKDDRGRTALHRAALWGKLEIVKYLVGQGGKINVQDDDGLTVFLAVILRGSPEIVKYLVEHGANIDAQDNEGQTALHKAVLNGYVFVKNRDRYLRIVKYLVEHGADVAITDKKGWTARDHAHENHELACNKPACEAYLDLVKDFYQVVAGKMGLHTFLNEYCETQDPKTNTSNLTDIRKLLRLGTRELADQFYAWCKKNNRFAVGDKWGISSAWMYFDLAIGAQKSYWYLLARDAALQDTSEEGKKFRNDMQKIYAKSENLQLQKDYVKWVQENQNKQNLKKLAITSSKFTIKQLHDCKINFKG